MDLKKKTMIVANWKMNPVSLKEAKHLFDSVRGEVKKLKSRSVEIVICPPFVWLDSLRGAFGAKTKSSLQLKLAAQDCFWESKGAYTGEISPLMLKSLGCSYVIIGHSERRGYMGESDEVVNQKIKTALRCGLKVILAVGEEERKDENAKANSSDDINLVVGDQLKKDLADIAVSKMTEVIIAYEPIWAIGTGVPCSSDQAMKAALFIKKIITELYNRRVAEAVRILYGGSVDSKNAANYVKDAGMNGLLVGGASLQSAEFVKIIDVTT